jgi:hypothetical protein
MPETIREEFLIADRDPVTEETIASLIRRSFASCDFSDSDCTEIISHLVEAHYAYRMAAAISEDEKNDDGWETVVVAVQNDKAEECYRDAYVAAYKEAGASEEYANESMYWPDSLPLNAPWDSDLLAELARFQVGHELVSMDYARALMEREKLNGSVQQKS